MSLKLAEKLEIGEERILIKLFMFGVSLSMLVAFSLSINSLLQARRRLCGTDSSRRKGPTSSLGLTPLKRDAVPGYTASRVCPLLQPEFKLRSVSLNLISPQKKSNSR